MNKEFDNDLPQHTDLDTTISCNEDVPNLQSNKQKCKKILKLTEYLNKRKKHRHIQIQVQTKQIRLDLSNSNHNSNYSVTRRKNWI